MEECQRLIMWYIIDYAGHYRSRGTLLFIKLGRHEVLRDKSVSVASFNLAVSAVVDAVVEHM